MTQTYTTEQIREFEGFMADPGRRAAFAMMKRRYDHVLSAVFSLPWAILPESMNVVATVLVEHLSGERPTSAEIAERIEGADQRRATPSPGGVAVIPIHGPIVPKAGGLAEVSGATSIARFRENFRGAMAAKEVRGIILDVDSPGGSVFGVAEMGEEIRAARGRKPIVAAIDGLGASAAYWLASQADEVVMTPSSLTGSIGVITAHEDVSEAAAAKGVKVTLISAGKHKTDGNSMAPLSDEARAHSQQLVDDYYAMFTGAVAKGRRVPVDEVRNGFGEGRVVNARMAVAMGMVDRVASLEDVAGEMLSPRVAAEMVGTPGPVGLTGFLETDEVTAEADPDGADPSDVPGTPEYEAGTEAFLRAIADMTDEDMLGAVDNSSWDGNRAMGQCSTAADYRSICAGEHSVGTPDERQHWALPHHYLGRGPNAAGVRAALSRLPQTENLKNRDAAQAHLDRHMAEINPERSEADVPTVESLAAELEFMRVPRSE